jgi:hypothetical protein
MNVFEFALGVILVTTLGAAIMTYLKNQRLGGDGENQRLRGEVEALRDRLAVLERIAVEKENSLERDIERLRDR